MLPGSPHCLAKLARGGRIHRLGRLDQQAVTQWLAGALGTEPTPSLTSAVFSTTEGNPLFVDTISRLLVSHAHGATLPSGFVLPDSIREVLLDLLARLSRDARVVVDAAWEQAVTKCQVMGIDATGVRIMDSPHDRRAHIWVLLADRAQVFFRYSALHTSDMPKSWLDGFQGIVVADASSVYDDLFRAPYGPTEAGCMAHCRRKYFFAMPTDARARPFVELADTLFAVERDAASLSAGDRLAVRKERSAPVIEHFARERDRLLDAPTVDRVAPSRVPFDTVEIIGKRSRDF